MSSHEIFFEGEGTGRWYNENGERQVETRQFNRVFDFYWDEGDDDVEYDLDEDSWHPAIESIAQYLVNEGATFASVEVSGLSQIT